MTSTLTLWHTLSHKHEWTHKCKQRGPSISESVTHWDKCVFASPHNCTMSAFSILSPDPLFLSSLVCQCFPFFPALHLTFLLQRKHFSLNSTTCYLGLKYPGLEKPQVKFHMLVPLTFYFLHSAQKHYSLALVCGCICCNTCYKQSETAFENRVHTNKRWETLKCKDWEMLL